MPCSTSSTKANESGIGKSLGRLHFWLRDVCGQTTITKYPELIALMETIYSGFVPLRATLRSLSSTRAFACEVAIFVRKHSGVDVCTVSFRWKILHAAFAADFEGLPALEFGLMDFFKGRDRGDESKILDMTQGEKIANGRMQALNLESYLFALNRARQLGTDAICALLVANLEQSGPCKAA